jgi:drug/metabolite transporter (DMT)-like permease
MVMRTAKEILSATKPMFDRMSDGLKVVGSGNTAGLVGMIAALNSVQPDHVHTVLLLKPTAIIFAIGIFLFAGAYLFLMYAYIYLERAIWQSSSRIKKTYRKKQPGSPRHKDQRTPQSPT